VHILGGRKEEDGTMCFISPQLRSWKLKWCLDLVGVFNVKPEAFSHQSEEATKQAIIIGDGRPIGAGVEAVGNGSHIRRRKKETNRSNN
jgi:hypothetical protein